MQPGDLEAGIVAGLNGAADWVDDALAAPDEIGDAP